MELQRSRRELIKMLSGITATTVIVADASGPGRGATGQMVGWHRAGQAGRADQRCRLSSPHL